MKKTLRIIKFLSINAVLTATVIYILAYYRVSDIYYTFCIYVPVLIQLISGKNLFYELNNINRRIQTGIMIISGFQINKLFLISRDDEYEMSDLYLRDEPWDLIQILIIYYLILILSEWFLSYNKVVNSNKSQVVNSISNKMDIIKVLSNLRKEGKISSELFEEEIEKLTK